MSNKKVITDKKLKVEFRQCWNSFMGALEGALDLLETNVDTDVVMGGTGYAFRINIHPGLKHNSIGYPWGDELGYAINRLGYAYRSLRSTPHLPVYDVYVEHGHSLILRGIDDAKASIVWNVQEGEFGLVTGYNDEEEIYYISGVLDDEEGDRRLPFSHLGKGKKEALGIYQPKEKICDYSEEKAVRSALEYAVTHGKGAAAIYRGSKAGLEGYDFWKEEVTKGDVDAYGASYTAQEVAEARKYVPDYLERVKGHFDEGLMKDVINHYKTVAKKLKEVADLFPFDRKNPQLPSGEDRKKAAGLIGEAREAEAKALEGLEKVIK